jgi:hypothetical protein
MLSLLSTVSHQTSLHSKLFGLLISNLCGQCSIGLFMIGLLFEQPVLICQDQFGNSCEKERACEMGFRVDRQNSYLNLAVEWKLVCDRDFVRR